MADGPDAVQSPVPPPGRAEQLAGAASLYLVTLRTHRDRPVLGEAVDGAMIPTAYGLMAEELRLAVTDLGVKLVAISIDTAEVTFLLSVLDLALPPRGRATRPAARLRHDRAGERTRIAEGVTRFKGAVTRRARRGGFPAETPFWATGCAQRLIRTRRELLRALAEYFPGGLEAIARGPAGE